MSGRVVLVSVLACVFFSVGCSGVPSYKSVDLGRDLPAETLARYESEWQALPSAERMHGMATLEKTNWWPLGLLGYYRRGSVMREDGPQGTTYHVEDGYGVGPLSVLFSRGTHATYDGTGTRLSGMRMDTWLLGHLFMSHLSDATLPGGRTERASSFHIFHHILAVHNMNGHRYVSLFTVPNPVGTALSRGHE